MSHLGDRGKPNVNSLWEGGIGRASYEMIYADRIDRIVKFRVKGMEPLITLDLADGWKINTNQIEHHRTE